MKPVFIHISKNAGTSIIASAGSQITVAGHRTAECWLAKNGREAPMFAVVRNPFDRVVSEYSYRKRRFETGEKNPHLANLDKTFEEWVIATFREGEFRTRDFFERTGIIYNRDKMIDGSLIWFIPQIRGIGSSRGQILVDDILRFENLAEDWKRFSRKYQITGDLQHREASRRELQYQPYYTEQAREIIANYYCEDFVKFGYQFG